MDRPFALAGFLADLRHQGLPLGVREHLAVNRLLARFDAADLETLRSALSCLLARNETEARLVRETFERHFVRGPAEEEEERTSPPSWTERIALRLRALRARFQFRWVAWMAGAIVVAALAGLAVRHFAPPSSSKIQEKPPAVDPKKSDLPVPDLNFPTPPPAVDPTRAALAAVAAAVLAFLALYLPRTRGEAERRGRSLWGEMASGLPGPRDYELRVELPVPLVRAADLDDVAAVLGRRVSRSARGSQLDVERTLERTLRAGLAPQIVLRAPRAVTPTVVLEDVSESMRPHRTLVRETLDGLGARGVSLDRWRFDTSAARVWRAADRVSISLKQLVRLRSEGALLVVSDGLGVIDGATLRMAPWVDLLLGWRARAWVHPVPDRAYWHAALRRVPCEVRPMTGGGLLAAARDLSRADFPAMVAPGFEGPAERPVVPLDVERMRWLLTLAPRRDPDLAELLRLRFCPNVPRSAVAEALRAPPRAEPPAVGPSADEVHAFLLEVLDGSRPPAGTMAFERWRLDRALQSIALDAVRETGFAELADLARGPLAASVEDRLAQMGVPGAPGAHRFERQSIAPGADRALARSVLRPIARRARRDGLTGSGRSGAGSHRWTLPVLGEYVACAVTAVLALSGASKMGPLVVNRVPATLWAYDLQVSQDAKGAAPTLRLTRRSGVPDDPSVAPDDVELQRAGKSLRPLRLDGRGIATYSPRPGERGAYFHAEARLPGGTVAMSQLVAVPAPGVPPIVVPRLIGRTILVARKVAVEAGLRLGQITRRDPGKADIPASPGPTDVIVRQVPAPGASAERGTPVDVVVDAPPQNPPKVVPDVRGLLLPEARRVLSQAGIRVGQVVRVPLTDQTKGAPQPGMVLAQRPAPGSSLTEGSTVSLEVQGDVAPPEPVTVPRLTGLTIAQAEKTLAGYRLKLGRVMWRGGSENQQNPAGPGPADGVVVDQKPTAGTRVEKGTAVDLVAGPAPNKTSDFVIVPNLIGMTLSNARAALVRSELRLGTVTRSEGTSGAAAPPAAPIEIVVDQKPRSGMRVPRGSAVDVVIRVGPPVTKGSPPRSSADRVPEERPGPVAARKTDGSITQIRLGRFSGISVIDSPA